MLTDNRYKILKQTDFEILWAPLFVKKCTSLHLIYFSQESKFLQKFTPQFYCFTPLRYLEYLKWAVWFVINYSSLVVVIPKMRHENKFVERDLLYVTLTLLASRKIQMINQRNSRMRSPVFAIFNKVDLLILELWFL